MKKLSIAFFAFLAICFFSCGEQTEQTEDADTIARDTIIIEDTISS